MSWSVTFNDRAAFDAHQPSFGAAIPVDARDQYDAAHEAAAALVVSGAVGNPPGDYVITLSGHSNPEHKPLAGYGNDGISLSVWQKPAPTPESPAAA
jgi:hypothetical protein